MCIRRVSNDDLDGGEMPEGRTVPKTVCDQFDVWSLNLRSDLLSESYRAHYLNVPSQKRVGIRVRASQSPASYQLSHSPSLSLRRPLSELNRTRRPKYVAGARY